jgi:hypothetical protein
VTPLGKPALIAFAIGMIVSIVLLFVEMVPKFLYEHEGVCLCVYAYTRAHDDMWVLAL